MRVDTMDFEEVEDLMDVDPETSIDVIEAIAAAELDSSLRYRWISLTLTGSDRVIHSDSFMRMADESMRHANTAMEWLALYEGFLELSFEMNYSEDDPSFNLRDVYSVSENLESEMLDLYIELEEYARDEGELGLAEWAAEMMIRKTRHVLDLRKVVGGL